MGYRRYPAMHWGYGHHGFFPPFALLFGFFMLFMLFHTGLWIPLLIGGLIFWGIRQHRRQDGGMWEKRKWGDWQPEDEPEKTKHSDYI